MNRRMVLALVLLALNTHKLTSQITQAQSGPVNDFLIDFPEPSPEDAAYYVRLPPDEQARFQTAADRAKAVWASDEFKRRVTSFVYKHHGHNNDADGNVVYTVITSAHPKHLKYYLCAKDADAYASTDQYWETTCVFPNYLQGEGKSINALVNTLTHEYTHTKSGGLYTHPYRRTGSRPQTVPYAIGDIAEEIANQMYPETPSIGAHAAHIPTLPQGTNFNDVVVHRKRR